MTDQEFLEARALEYFSKGHIGSLPSFLNMTVREYGLWKTEAEIPDRVLSLFGRKTQEPS